MTTRLYHAVVLVGVSAIGTNAACASQSVTPAKAPTDSSAAAGADAHSVQGDASTPHNDAALDASAAAAEADATFDAAAEADAGWHPTK